MVKYKLFFKEKNIFRYYYYVFGNLNSEPGIIEVNLEKETIEIITPAPNDFLETFTIEDALSLREGINEIRKGNGEPEVTENELKIPKKDTKYYRYGSPAMRDISGKLEKDNKLPENGTVAWN